VVTVGEQVERVQVAVADDVRGRRGRVIGQPAGGFASEKEKSSAQKPPVIGSGWRAYSRPGVLVALCSTSISWPFRSTLTVTVFTVTVDYGTV
jgi:hypothetical protein